MSTLRWTIILAGGTIAAVLGLWTGPTVTTAPKAGVSETPPVASAGPRSTETVPETLKFVPSPFIDPNPTFFLRRTIASGTPRILRSNFVLVGRGDYQRSVGKLRHRVRPVASCQHAGAVAKHQPLGIARSSRNGRACSSRSLAKFASLDRFYAMSTNPADVVVHTGQCRTMTSVGPPPHTVRLCKLAADFRRAA
jgi:hypothetical protein